MHLSVSHVQAASVECDASEVGGATKNITFDREAHVLAGFMSRASALVTRCQP